MQRDQWYNKKPDRKRKGNTDETTDIEVEKLKFDMIMLQFNCKY